jgi:hypothetical protein
MSRATNSLEVGALEASEAIKLLPGRWSTTLGAIKLLVSGQGAATSARAALVVAVRPAWLAVMVVAAPAWVAPVVVAAPAWVAPVVGAP